MFLYMFPFVLGPGLIVALSLLGAALLRWRMRGLYRKNAPEVGRRREQGIEVEFSVEDADGKK